MLHRSTKKIERQSGYMDCRNRSHLITAWINRADPYSEADYLGSLLIPQPLPQITLAMVLVMVPGDFLNLQPPEGVLGRGGHSAFRTRRLSSDSEV